MSDLQIALTLTADGRQLISTVNGSEKAVAKLNTKLNATSASGSNASQGLSRVERQSNQTGLSLKRLGVYAGSAFAGLSAINLSQKMVRDLASFQDLRTRLTQLSGSASAYADNQKYLIELAREHNKELTVLGNSYASMLNMQDAGLVTQKQARQITEGMSNAQSSVGASSVQLSQAMYGLSQALASPIVRAEELNQLVEPLPGLLNKMGEVAGLDPLTGGFRKMVLEGKVTSAFLRTTLIEALKEYDGAAAATANNISAKIRAVQLSYDEMLIAFEKPINTGAGGALTSLSDSIRWVTNNAELLTQLVGVGLVMALTRATQAAVTHTASLITKANAERAAQAAAMTTAQAELQRATIQRGAVLTSGQAVVAEQRLVAARNAVTAATARTTLATRALNRTMSLAGGPAGLLLMGAAALGSLALSARDAKADIAGLDDEVDSLLGRTEKIASRKLDNVIEQQMAKIDKLEDQKEEALSQTYQPTRFTSIYQAEFNAITALSEQQGEAAKAQLKEINEVNAKLKQANDDLAALKAKQAETQTKTSQTQVSVINNEQKTLLESLTKQKALFGDVSEAAKVRYEIEHGKLKDLDPVVNAKILQTAKEIDATKRAADASKTAADAIQDQQDSILQLLSAIDPVTTAANELADKEKLLKTYFEQANVPLEKRRELLAALKDEYAIESDYERLSNELSPTRAENQKHQDNMAILNNELAITPEDDLAKRMEIHQRIEDEALRHSDAIREINGELTLDYKEMWTTTFQQFSAGVGSATADAMFEAKSLSDGVQQAAKGAAKAVVKMLVEYGVQKLAAAALDRGIMQTNAAVAQSTAATTGASMAASMAPAAATSSIASFGTAAIVGMAAMVAGMALLPSIIGQFHGGGTIPREGTYLLDGGETIYTRKQHAVMMNAMQASSRGGGARGMNMQQQNTIVVNNQSEAESLEDVLPQLVAMTKAAVIEDLNNRGDVWQAQKG
ncbi:tape measure protein [uncultured Shewanella sp.]|uniref:tape measure protein n=1 Tax=uncultured Shewanella sp. TaxID=173975 RepID=UPI00263A0D58|nr:tape measure protein [uncultured Shewanella sp.]